MKPLDFHFILYFILTILLFYGLFLLTLIQKRNNQPNPLRDKPKSALQYPVAGPILAIAYISSFYFVGKGFGRMELSSVIAVTLQLLGMLLFIFSLIWAGWSIIALGRNFSVNIEIHQKQTVSRNGPYQYVRHPIYLSLILGTFSLSLLFLNYIFFFTTLVIGTIDTLRAAREEKLLIQYLGEDYITYQQEVPMIIPFFGKRR